MLFGLNGIINGYKINEFINGEWLLNKIVSLTLGSSYHVQSRDDFSLIDYDNLETDECLAIINNYKRNIKNLELVYYKPAKVLNKHID